MTDTSGTPATEQQPKWFLQSKTIWGIIVMLIPSLANLLGVSIPLEDVQSIRDGVLKIAEAAMTVSGAVLAVYGRFKAKRPIKADTD